MSICCRDIFNFPELTNIKLVGGKNGLDRSIRWVYFGDSTDDMCKSPQWLNGHELVVITGTFYSGKPEKLADSLRQLNEIDIAGFLISIGPYIPEIPQEVIDVADELALPLFELPWEVKLVDATKAICNAIIANEMEETRFAGILDELLFGNMEVPSELSNYLRNSNRTANEWVVGKTAIVNPEVIVKNSLGIKSESKNSGTALKNRIKDALQTHHIPALLTARGNETIFLISRIPDLKSRLADIIGDVEKAICIRCPEIRLRTGYCITGKTSTELKTGLRRAGQAYCAAGLNIESNNILSYDEMGILSLITEIEDTTVLEHFFKDTLGPLIDYDRVNKTELYRTLSAYFENDGDQNKTADALFVHRNTMKYRIERICEILNRNIRKSDDFIQIGIALKVADILSGSV